MLRWNAFKLIYLDINQWIRNEEKNWIYYILNLFEWCIVTVWISYHWSPLARTSHRLTFSPLNTWTGTTTGAGPAQKYVSSKTLQYFSPWPHFHHRWPGHTTHSLVKTNKIINLHNYRITHHHNQSCKEWELLTSPSAPAFHSHKPSPCPSWLRWPLPPGYQTSSPCFWTHKVCPGHVSGQLNTPRKSWGVNWMGIIHTQRGIFHVCIYIKS